MKINKEIPIEPDAFIVMNDEGYVGYDDEGQYCIVPDLSSAKRFSSIDKAIEIVSKFPDNKLKVMTLHDEGLTYSIEEVNLNKSIIDRMSTDMLNACWSIIDESSLSAEDKELVSSQFKAFIEPAINNHFRVVFDDPEPVKETAPRSEPTTVVSGPVVVEDDNSEPGAYPIFDKDPIEEITTGPTVELPKDKVEPKETVIVQDKAGRPTEIEITQESSDTNPNREEDEGLYDGAEMEVPSFNNMEPVKSEEEKDFPEGNAADFLKPEEDGKIHIGVPIEETKLAHIMDNNPEPVNVDTVLGDSDNGNSSGVKPHIAFQNEEHTPAVSIDDIM